MRRHIILSRPLVRSVSLQIDTSRLEQEILLVKLSGNITRAEEQYTDEPFIHDLLRHGEKKMIVDLSCVDQMDSSGVQLLYECFSAVRKTGGELRFVGANARVARLFQITKLDAVLQFYLTIAGACESFPQIG